jgi:hypothetical protein
LELNRFSALVLVSRFRLTASPKSDSRSTLSFDPVVLRLQHVDNGTDERKVDEGTDKAISGGAAQGGTDGAGDC